MKIAENGLKAQNIPAQCIALGQEYAHSNLRPERAIELFPQIIFIKIYSIFP